MLKKRGQVSIEFMSTYAWTIAALVMVLGVLGYFGVFDANNYKIETCTLTRQLECTDAYINSSGNLSVYIKNNYAKAIVIEEFNITNFDPDVSTNPGIVIEPGESRIVGLIDSTHTFIAKNKEDFFFSVTYHRNPIGTSNTIRGHAISEVQ